MRLLFNDHGAKNPVQLKRITRRSSFTKPFISINSTHNETDYNISEGCTDFRGSLTMCSGGRRTAEYMAVYEYKQQDGVDENYFENVDAK